MPVLMNSKFVIEMRRIHLFISIFALLVTIFTFSTPTLAFTLPSNELQYPIKSKFNFNNLFSHNIATLNYETKESTSLTDPITDPNFNVMRNKEIGKSFAIPLVVGILLLAIAAPLVTWWYFSK